MKNKILILSFFLLSFSASAQYFQVGMEWVYGEYTLTPGWPPTISTVTIIGDTLINNEPAFVLNQPEVALGASASTSIRYISENGQQVYYYLEGEKRLLYDFSLEVGDTLAVKGQWCCEGDELDSLICSVDSIHTISLNGMELKTQHFCGGEWMGQHVEGVGSLYSFFPNYPLADNTYSKLRCVIYPNGDILKFTDDEDCYVILGVNDIRSHGLSVYPNPIVDNLFIENQQDKTYELRIFSPQGQLIYAALQQNGSQSIGTSHWAKGIYLMHLVVDDMVFSKLLVKE